MLYASIAYLIVWAAGFGAFGNREYLDALIKQMHLGGPHGFPSGHFSDRHVWINPQRFELGEEIGWRGFLVPELSKTTPFTVTSIISGIVWSLWHYPVLIYGDYNAGTPTWYGLTCFTVMVVAISFVFAWIRLKSGSLWTGAILHARHNL